MRWSATSSPLARRVIPKPIFVNASYYRPCTLKPEAQALIQLDDGTPILCFKQWGMGYCFYLNAVFDSQYNTDDNEVVELIKRLFILLNTRIVRNKWQERIATHTITGGAYAFMLRQYIDFMRS
jgi:hypothetical protein